MNSADTWQYYLHTLTLFDSGALVLLGFFGLAFIQAGMVRSKNATSVLAKNFIMLSAVIIVYFFLGQQLMYGGNASEKFITYLIGRVLHIQQTTALATSYHPLAATFFQLFLPCLALSVVASTTAERLKLWSFILFSLLFGGIIYPITGACYWGKGFLYGMGFIDQNGAGIVFLLSAIAGLVGSIFVGPRADKFKSENKINPLPASNIPLALFGAGLFWLGNIGFNSGVHFAGEEPIALAKFMQVVINCCIVGASSLFTCAIITRITYGAMDMTFAINGLICGMVAISANANSPTAEVSLIIGVVSGIITLPALFLTERCHVDDPMGIATVSLVGSIWGLLIVSLTSHESFAWSWLWQMLLQVCGIALIVTWGIISCIIAWAVVRFIVGLRIEDNVEMRGLDIYDCAMEAYPEFTISRE